MFKLLLFIYVVGLGVNNNGCQSTPEAVMINLKDQTPVRRLMIIMNVQLEAVKI